MSNLNTRTFAGCTSGAKTENTWCGTTNIVTDYVTTYNCATLALALALALALVSLVSRCLVAQMKQQAERGVGKQ